MIRLRSRQRRASRRLHCHRLTWSRCSSVSYEVLTFTMYASSGYQGCSRVLCRCIGAIRIQALSLPQELDSDSSDGSSTEFWTSSSCSIQAVIDDSRKRSLAALRCASGHIVYLRTGARRIAGCGIGIGGSWQRRCYQH